MVSMVAADTVELPHEGAQLCHRIWEQAEDVGPPSQGSRHPRGTGEDVEMGYFSGPLPSRASKEMLYYCLDVVLQNVFHRRQVRQGCYQIKSVSALCIVFLGKLRDVLAH